MSEKSNAAFSISSASDHTYDLGPILLDSIAPTAIAIRYDMTGICCLNFETLLLSMILEPALVADISTVKFFGAVIAAEKVVLTDGVS